MEDSWEDRRALGNKVHSERDRMLGNNTIVIEAF